MNSIKFFKHNNTGFTLIEVMVAAVILFSVIATVSMVYRGAFLSSEKADEHINVAAVIPSVLATIQTEIRNKENEQKNLLTGKKSAWQINYQWHAKLLEQKSPSKKYDAFTNKLASAPIKYKLWQVQLTLEYKGYTKQYQFKELSWLHE
ncbi:MAG: prepilin-type N-terminal cleavage/methylation domain-containing protein [Colwellia sp.]